MALVKWIAASGDWLTASDWSTGTVPQASDDVQIEIPNITVTLSTGTLAVSTLTTVSSTLSVAGGTLTSGSALNIGGAYLQTGGAVELYGSGATFRGPVTQTGGLIALNVGALTSYGTFLENGGTLSLGYQGGTFSTLTLQAGTISSTAAVLYVGSNFSQTGGLLKSLGRDVTLAGTFSQAAGGTITLNSGALDLVGTGTLAGTISGGGTLLVQSGTTTLASGVVLSLPKLSLTGGKLVLGAAQTVKALFTDAAPSTVALNGQTLTLAGNAALGGEFQGPGRINVNGGGSINGLSLDGTALMSVTSTVTETGYMSLGSVAGSRTQFSITTNGQLRIAGNWATFDQSGNGVLTNAGTIAKTGGSGVDTIYTNVVSTGTINVGPGSLAFAGPSATFGGTVSGTGTFALSGGQQSFASNLVLSVGRVAISQPQANEQLTLTNSLTYGGEWSQSAGTLWLNGPAVTLTETGRTSLNGGLITGNGTLATTAASHLNVSNVDFEGTATLDVSGIVNQTGNVGFGAQIGSADNLIIESGAVWHLENNGSLGGPINQPAAENGNIVNNGILTKANGSANSNIVGTLTNNGTLQVGNSTLSLYGWGTLGGAITGHGSLELQGTYTLGSGLALSVGDLGIGSGTITLGGNLAAPNIWSQSGGTLDLGGNTLTLSGLTSLESGMMDQLGTVLANGATTIGDNYVVSQGTLVIGTSADQIGDIYVGDYSVLTNGTPQAGFQPASNATLMIASGATYKLDDNVNINSNGTLAVSGTLTALGGGASTVGPSVVDNGAIFANSAALRFVGPVSGSGSLVIGAGGSLDFASTVAVSNTISFTTGTGSVLVEDPLNNNGTPFAATIAGFQSGDFIEFSGISSVVANDTLTLNTGGTVATITDTNGDIATITFATAQTSASLSLGLGTHGALALFHS